MGAKRTVPLPTALLVGLWFAGAALPSQAQNFVEGTHYWLEPAAFQGAPRDEYHRGPNKAKGAVIWNDGYDPQRHTSEKIPPIVRYFAEAGWDAFNLGRHSGFHTQRIAPLILLATEKVKAKGYKRIVLIGHSAGAFASIEVGSYGADVTGILALAPAGHGDFGQSSHWRQNDYFLRTMWDSYKDSRVLVAAGFFAGDDWYETKEPHVRGPYASRRLDELGVTNFIVSEPAYSGMSSHFGGVGMEFARRFGPCLEYFFDTGQRPSCDDGAPDTPALFGVRPPPVPKATRDGFAGQWQGTIATGRFVVLTIPPLAGNRSVATYQTGRGVDDEKPESANWSLIQRGGMLVREGRYEFRLRTAPDDRLKITYMNNAGTGAEKDFAILSRMTAE